MGNTVLKKFKSVLRAVCQPTLAGFESARIFHSNPDSHGQLHKLHRPSSSWKGRFLTAPLAHIWHGG